MSEFVDGFLADYFAECDEHLTHIRQVLVLLEPSVGKAQANLAAMQDLFRDFHSLKGISAIVGLRAAEEDGKLIRTPAPGMTLRYLLSGLIYCKCGMRMTASSSSTYIAKGGDTRRYVSYVCPSYLAGTCANSKRVPEDWIRTMVINKLKERLFSAE